MKVGVSRRRITPAIGSRLDGYRARHGVSTGIHDDLFSRAIAVEGQTASTILVSVDVLALSSSFTAAVRRRISEATSVPYNSIVVAATHTHSGPHVIRTFFNADWALDEQYMAHLEEVVAQNGADSWFNRVPARIGIGRCEVTGLGGNRRCAGSRSIDREAAIVRVDRPDGTLMAALMIYGCHPTVLGVQNLSISADFPAAAIEAVERTAVPASFAMFLNGAEGNVSIGRSSNMSAIGLQNRGRTFTHAWELGGRLAKAVLEELPRIQSSESTAIKAAQVNLALEGRSFAPLENLKADVVRARQREAIAKCHPSSRASKGALLEAVYAEAKYNNARELARRNNTLKIPVTGVRIGSAMLAAIPAEIFSETGVEIKSRVYREAIVIGLANGYFGYLPAEAAWNEGGYEVEVSPFPRGAEQRLIGAVRKLRALLFGGISSDLENLPG